MSGHSNEAFKERQRPSRFERSDDVVVLKFEGTSLEDAAAIRRLIDVVRNRLDARPVVVVSGLARTAEQLLEAGNAAVNGHLGSALATARGIYVRHEHLADSLVAASASGTHDRELRKEFRALEALLHDLECSRQLDPNSQDSLLGFGECFSSRLVTEALCEAGINAAYVDTRACIFTDALDVNAPLTQTNPVYEMIEQGLQEALSPLLEFAQVPVMGGFIVSAVDGVPAVWRRQGKSLGRGGSDFTAAIVGTALCAARIEIWTDIDGIMTTEAKLCSDAHARRIGFDEASELAQLGAKVLRPTAPAPASGRAPI
jgi:aspartate kinase